MLEGEDMDDDKNATVQLIDDAINNTELEEIYFNGFQITMGNGDLMIFLNRNGKVVKKVNLSYTMAKTLSEKLGLLIANIEQKTENNIMTTDDINKKMGESDE